MLCPAYTLGYHKCLNYQQQDPFDRDKQDPQMPKIPEYAWHYYWGLNGARNKFESLLKSFEFVSIREIIKI